jgi:hypothetical protein
LAGKDENPDAYYKYKYIVCVCVCVSSGAWLRDVRGGAAASDVVVFVLLLFCGCCCWFRLEEEKLCAYGVVWPHRLNWRSHRGCRWYSDAFDPSSSVRNIFFYFYNEQKKKNTKENWCSPPTPELKKNFFLFRPSHDVFFFHRKKIFKNKMAQLFQVNIAFFLYSLFIFWVSSSGVFCCFFTHKNKRRYVREEEE